MRELWELLCRIRHTGERHWQPHKERHSILEKPCQTSKSVTVGNLNCSRGRANESHLHKLDHTVTRSHTFVCARTQTVARKALGDKSPATSNIAFQWGIQRVLTVLKETYSLIRLLSKLPSPRECPAEKGFFFAEINNCFPIRSCSGKIMPPLHSSKAIFFPLMPIPFICNPCKSLVATDCECTKVNCLHAERKGAHSLKSLWVT